MSDRPEPSTPDDEPWALKHRDKMEPLLFALAHHFGGERLAPEIIEWRLMRHKSGLEFMVARFHEYDYWLDPLTGELRWEEH
jgi:hypothetical protein